MKSMKIAIIGALALVTAPMAMALDATITDTTIVGQTTSNWNSNSHGNGVTNNASVGVQTKTGKDAGFTKEFNWSQTRTESKAYANGNSVSNQNTKVVSFSNGLNTFGTIDSKNVESKVQLGGKSTTLGATTSGSFKVSVTGTGGVKLKDKIGAGSDFGGKKGAHNHGTYEPGAERPGMSFDITNTDVGFTDKAGKIFENATVWVPNTPSAAAQDKQNKASMSFSKSVSVFKSEQNDIKGTTTTTSLTSGSFLN